jgi:hypothetical protein
MIALSLVCNVLESYEVVRRQLLHLGRILPPGCELVLVDDGSEPSLEATCASVPLHFPFRLFCTHDRRPWTQPSARNGGAALAQTDKLLFFDIDHILTRDLLNLGLGYAGDKLHWVRRPGALDAAGNLVTDPAILRAEYGLTNQADGIHANSFFIRREIFERVGGYDERFCGRYGGDDIDFNTRYDRLCGMGLARPAQLAGDGYYFPDPGRCARLFHGLARNPH